jgi:prepilin-type N-terminal cleavage/methylation domain-containing protein
MQQYLTRQGFTLVELMVVISIMGILAGGIAFYATQAGKSGRDADRQSDLRALQAAIELYKQRNGRYPEGCNGANNWSGELGMGTGFECLDGSREYIIGLAPTFIPVLPRDPLRACATDCGYTYVTNADGSVFKLVARKSVESEVVDYSHPMKSCDVRPTSGNRPATDDILQVGLCGRIRQPGALGTFAHVYPYDEAPAPSISSIASCSDTNPNFTTSYGVWGGFAPLQATAANRGACNIAPVNLNLTEPLAALGPAQKVCAVLGTTDIICK